MPSFFKGKVRWWDGLYLSPEHLEEENNYVIDAYRSIKHILTNYEHVELLKYNDILLTRGVLEIVEFKGMLANLQYIEYNMDDPIEVLNTGDKSGHIYEIREDLSKFSKIIMEKGLLFHLSVEMEEVQVVDCINNNRVEKLLPKLTLLPEHLIKNTHVAIPILRIISDKGGYIVDDTYEAPMTFISKERRIYTLMEKFIKFLRNTSMEVASGFFTKQGNENNTEDVLLERMNYSLQYNSIMVEVLVLESSLYSKQHPVQIFLSLQRIIGGLSLLRFTNLPSLQLYDHYDIYGSILNLTLIIIDMIKNLKVDGERLQLEYKDKKFMLPIPMEVFIPSNKTYLLLEMDKEGDRDILINWVEDARICGEEFEAIINMKRVRGIDRKIYNTSSFGNKVIVVELNMQSEYINPSSKALYVYNDYNDYVPSNIVLCWRTIALE